MNGFRNSQILMHPGDAAINMVVNLGLLVGLLYRFGWLDGFLIYASLKFIAPAMPRVPAPELPGEEQSK